MKRRILILSGVLVVLLLLAALVLPYFIDVDSHRPDIEAALASALGREVRLGALRLRILPLPALTAAGITIADDKTYGDEPFLKADRCAVSVRIFPLLRGEVAVDSVSVDSPRVRLRRKADRTWNVASLAREEAPPGSAPGAAPAAPGAKPAAGSGAGASKEKTAGGVSLSVRRLSISGGNVTLVDEGLEPGRKTTTELNEISLVVRDLSAASPVRVDLSFRIAGAGGVSLQGKVGPPPASGSGAGWPVDGKLELDGFDGKAAAPYLAEFTGLKIHGGKLDLDISLGGAVPGKLEGEGSAVLSDIEADPLMGGGAPVRLSGKVALAGSYDGDETRLKKCDVTTGGSSVSITGSVKGLSGDPVVDARVAAKKVALADVKSVLGLVGPILPPGLGSAGEITMDAQVRGAIGRPAQLSIEGTASLSGLEYKDPALKQPIRDIQGALALKGGRVEISGFAASLGKSSVTGTCAISRFERPVIEAHLASRRIDLDNLMALLATTGATESASAQPRGPDLASFGGPAPPARSWIPAAQGAPAAGAAASMLSTITMRGDLAVERMKVVNLELTGVKAALGMEDGQARLTDMVLSLYKGGLAGNLSASLAENGPPFSLSANLQGVDFNALATDFSPDLKGLLYGTLGASLNVTGRGLDRPALRRNLTGTGSLSLADGKLTSFGALKLLAKALKAAGGSGVGEDETPFKSLSATFDIADGRARTQDLKLVSDAIKMKGKGEVRLDLGLDLDLTGRISEQVSGDMVEETPALKYVQDDKGRISLDFRVGGTLMEPKVGIDPEFLRRSARESVKEEGLNILDKLLNKKKKKKN